LRAAPKEKRCPDASKNAALALYCAVIICLSGNSVTDALSDMPAPSESVLSSGVSFKQEIPAQTEFETQQFYQPQMHHVADEPVLTPMKYQLECFVSGGAYTYKTLETDIERMAQKYTPLVSYESIGQSVNGKDIFALTIGGGKNAYSDNGRRPREGNSQHADAHASSVRFSLCVRRRRIWGHP
jgi:hypothetical protein